MRLTLKVPNFTGEVISVKPKRSDPVQGGFEIPMAILVGWSDSRSLVNRGGLVFRGERLWTLIYTQNLS